MEKTLGTSEFLCGTFRLLSSKSSLMVSGEAEEAHLILSPRPQLSNSWLGALSLESPETLFGPFLCLKSTHTENAILVNTACSTVKAEDPGRE